MPCRGSVKVPAAVKRFPSPGRFLSRMRSPPRAAGHRASGGAGCGSSRGHRLAPSHAKQLRAVLVHVFQPAAPFRDLLFRDTSHLFGVVSSNQS